MPFPVLLTKDAERDLIEIYDYIASHDSPGKADHVLVQFEKTFIAAAGPATARTVEKQGLALNLTAGENSFSDGFPCGKDFLIRRFYTMYTKTSGCQPLDKRLDISAEDLFVVTAFQNSETTASGSPCGPGNPLTDLPVILCLQKTVPVFHVAVKARRNTDNIHIHSGHDLFYIPEVFIAAAGCGIINGRPETVSQNVHRAVAVMKVNIEYETVLDETFIFELHDCDGHIVEITISRRIVCPGMIDRKSVV